MYNMQETRAIDNLDDMTGIIKNELNNITEGFVAVGYYLRKTAKDELYRQKGYQNLFDYAKENFGIKRTTAIRFMEINEKYSIGGYSPEIDEKWRGYGSSKLTEMLGLPEEIREEVPAEATVKDLREAKTIIKETESKYSSQLELCDVAQEEPELQDWMRQVVIEICRDKKIFMEMVEYERKDIGNDRKGIEEDILTMVNPSKFKMLRMKRANVFMQEKAIRVMPYKINGVVPDTEEFTYIDLAMAFEELCYPNYPDISEPAQEIYERIYGEPLYEKKEEPKEEPKQEQTPGKPRDSKKQEAKNNDSRPVHQVEEPKEQSEEQIPGQTELTKDFPEYCPDAMNPPEEPCEEVQEEPVEAAYGTRLQFLSKCTDEEKGAYMAAVMKDRIRKMNNTSFKIFAEGKFWKDLLTAEVDEEGREIECVN